MPKFSAGLVEQIRKVNAHQKRRKGELKYDLSVVDRRTEDLKAELAETERGIAETNALLAKIDGGGGDDGESDENS